MSMSQQIREDWCLKPDDDSVPTDEEVLFYAYDGCYEMEAICVWQRDGVLYEANGSHCSCMGLENQWSPEETSWEALAKRKFYLLSQGSKDELRELIAQHVVTQ